ncbi:MAG: polyamine aminopropyltransferase [Thermodesulfovibrionales bacterium]|nr:polyamine aminopropyltransferase [Thermodesulfovibrionales bacterium]
MIRFVEEAPFVPTQISYEISNILYKGRSRFQEIEVVENPDFGRMLLLDGAVQLTEADEFFYHEMLTHVLMHSHPNPRRVVVIGGGDGGALREVLRHKTVEKVFFVEIDGEVIKVAEKFFPRVASGNKDPRVEIRVMDGAEFIKKRPKSDIDVIIVDSTDIIGFARTLFTQDFFKAVRNCLREEGMFVTHSESILFHRDTVVKVQKILKDAFPVVDLYASPLATYPGYWWSYAVGSMKLSPREVRRPHKIKTKFYDNEIHGQSFITKKFYEKLMAGKLDWALKGTFSEK